MSRASPYGHWLDRPSPSSCAHSASPSTPTKSSGRQPGPAGGRADNENWRKDGRAIALKARAGGSSRRESMSDELASASAAGWPPGYLTKLERLGYTHLEMSCATCGHVGTKSFFLLRTRGTIADETTFAAVVERIRCAKCRQNLPPTLIRPLQAPAGGKRRT
jgi:hypothetical protein